MIGKSPELVDAAIEHICFLADVNRLYDNALGLYDLELALLVAQQSQKDPKEYLPFLRNLQKEPPLRRQYSIDNHLGRHQKALKHLCELKAFEEVKSYAVKHTLYSNAMEFYRYQEDTLKELMRLYGDYLHQQGKFKEAGIGTLPSSPLFFLPIDLLSLRIPHRLPLSQRIIPPRPPLERNPRLRNPHSPPPTPTPLPLPNPLRHPHRI